jgi:hypothetical protein
VHNPVAAYNTIVMPGNTSSSPPPVFSSGGRAGAAALVNPLIHDNYINRTGVLYSIVSTPLQDKTGVVNPVTYNNNGHDHRQAAAVRGVSRNEPVERDAILAFGQRS